MEKLFYSISETASILGETTVTVRFWTNNFKRFLAPCRNAKGNRQYTSKDIETLKQIHYLTRECGMSLDAVSKKLALKTSTSDKTMEIRESLLKIKDRLEQIKKTL